MCLPTHTSGRKQIWFLKNFVFYYLEFWTMDKVQKPNNFEYLPGCTNFYVESSPVLLFSVKLISRTSKWCIMPRSSVEDHISFRVALNAVSQSCVSANADGFEVAYKKCNCSQHWWLTAPVIECMNFFMLASVFYIIVANSANNVITLSNRPLVSIFVANSIMGLFILVSFCVIGSYAVVSTL
jgi:hypothetical protein